METIKRGIDVVKIQKLQSEPFIRVCKESEVYYDSVKVNKPQNAVELLRNIIDYSNVEKFIVACLDVKNVVKAVALVSQGTISSALVSPAVVLQIALAVNAFNILVCHNHPSGDVNPSNQDLEITSRLDEATRLIGLKLLDHIIITDESYYSFKENEHI